MILIAIGANLDGPDGAPPLDTCRAAVRALAELPGTRLAAVSRWYQSKPVPPSGQPDYVNGVVRLERVPGAAIDPAALLADLHAIEARFGRRRGEINAARTLDLDLIDLDGIVRDTPDPVLPHPRAHLRAFVLLPLLDVAPDWVRPGGGETGRALLAATDRTGIVVLTA
ncbi:MAG: 2-amino-4-hydroxy-6-hydroxymethyldihydropteridine diphosphokinase [Acetobacteraceae bacterium]|nr:2-amino-4-hydroxy-6-hydroxymethyldihydropteridine diphosphokinase [Acetobacteraceae bacterium]